MKALFIIILVTLSACVTNDNEIQKDPIFEETQIRNSRPKLENERFDKQELDLNNKLAFEEADKYAERKVGNVNRDHRFIYEFWEHKKYYLNKKFNIVWSSPAELNPEICYESYGQPCLTEIEKEYLLKFITDIRVSQSEELSKKYMYRDFKGYVHVATNEAVTDTVRSYMLIGADEKWTFLDVGIIEE